MPSLFLALVAIALLGKIAFSALRDYRRQRSAGDTPVFHVNNIKGPGSDRVK